MARDYTKIKAWQRTEELALLVYAKEFQKMEIDLILLRQFTKSPLFPLCQRGKLLSPSLKKRGEGRFSDQTAQHIRLASRHKRYLSE